MSIIREKSKRFDEIRKLLLDLNDGNILDTLNSIGEIVNCKFGTSVYVSGQNDIPLNIRLIEDLSDSRRGGKLSIVIWYFLGMFEASRIAEYPTNETVQKMFNLNPNSSIASNVRRMLKYDFKILDSDWKLTDKAMWNSAAIKTWKEKHPED